MGSGLIDYFFWKKKDVGKRKMVSISLTIFRAKINALAFVGTNHAFSKTGVGDTEVVCKRHDITEEKLRKAKDKWYEERFIFINQMRRRKVNQEHAWLSTTGYL